MQFLPCPLQAAPLHSFAGMRSIYRANLRTDHSAHLRTILIGSRTALCFALYAPLSHRISPRYAAPCQSANAILRQPRAMFSYRLLLFISCYYVARHSINYLRKRTPSHEARRPLLLRLAAATATARQGKAPCQAERSGGRDKASHPRRGAGGRVGQRA